ncbi:MAG TPA: NAD(P)-dependent oxidoreductase, partial [Bacteroidales bacterium]|nr:NAD(P)-dependent oxidoreductase [Bacteroidales bacterium]
MKIGIVRETKTPPDRRTPLTPAQCRQIVDEYTGTEIFVQPDGYRCFTDDEYKSAGIPLKEDLSGCDVLMGVKEVEIAALIPGKTYFFFSHTAKKQGYNRKLLQAVLDKNITLIDYEYLTSDDNTRVVAFGRWAGIVGAYNGLNAWGRRYQKFELKPAWKCRDKNELFQQLKQVNAGKVRILITGGGRVAQGAMETLSTAGIKKVTVDDYLGKIFNEAVYCQIDPWHYVKRLDGQDFQLDHFFHFPEEYQTTFLPYTSVTDLLIACHFWDPRSPVFMTREDMKRPDFRIRVVADVSCDIDGPIPSTLRASSIADPVYGYDPVGEKESAPFDPSNIT